MVMKVTLNPDNQEPFEFTVNCKEMDTVLSRLNSVVGTNSVGAKSFFLLASKGKVAILAFNTDTFAIVEIGEGSSTSDGAFGFDPTYLQGLIKGRANMNFKFTGTECEFKLVKGKYNGKLVVLPISMDQATTVNSAFSSKAKGDDATLNREVLDAVKEGLTLIGIKDVYSGAALLSYLDLSAKGYLTVTCFDQHHFGHYKVKAAQKGVAFKIALPNSHFQIIDKMIEGEEAKFFIKSESIKVQGTNFALILPASQTEANNFTMVGDYLKSLEKPELLAQIELDRFSTVVDNLFTIYSANTSVELSCKEGATAMGITLSTNHGSASDSLPMKVATNKTVKAKIEPRLLKDLLNVVRGQGSASLSLKQRKWLKVDLTVASGANLVLVGSLVG